MKTAEELRKQHNQELLEKMKNGESLAKGTLWDSFFPDRSKGFIKKDIEALKKLYGENVIKIGK